MPLICTLKHCSGVSSVTQSCPTLCVPWPVACQAPLPMEFSSQEYWSEVPVQGIFLQGIFPTQGSNPYLLCPALAGIFFITSTTWKALKCC